MRVAWLGSFTKRSIVWVVRDIKNTFLDYTDMRFAPNVSSEEMGASAPESSR